MAGIPLRFRPMISRTKANFPRWVRFSAVWNCNPFAFSAAVEKLSGPAANHGTIRGMVNRREYVSPDGLLRFWVTTDKDGDRLLGFEGYEWHTHANLLSCFAGVTEDDAVEKFVQELIGNQTIIAISRVDGAITNVRVTYDPESELLAPVPGETIELRYWNGKPWAGF